MSKEEEIRVKSHRGAFRDDENWEREIVANRLRSHDEQEQEELDAIERPASQAQVEETKDPMCRCYGCKKLFPASEIERGVCPAEYGETHVSYEASPCCRMGFWEDEEEDIYECEHCNAEFKESEILQRDFGGETGGITFCPRCKQETKLICITEVRK